MFKVLFFFSRHCLFKSAERTAALCMSCSHYFYLNDSAQRCLPSNDPKGNQRFLCENDYSMKSFSQLAPFRKFSVCLCVTSSLKHVNFTGTIFLQFKEFSQGQNKAMGKGEWVNQSASRLLFVPSLLLRLFLTGSDPIC